MEKLAFNLVGTSGSILLLAVIVSSCGSSQSTGYYKDGIYGSDESQKMSTEQGYAYQQQPQSSGVSSEDYKYYFERKALEAEQDLTAFTDIEEYSSPMEYETTTEPSSLGYTSAAQGWGDNPQSVTINYIDSYWGGWYGPYWGGWYNWGWNGWYGPGWGISWGWGYTPYYGYWGGWYGPGWGYCGWYGPGYGHGPSYGYNNVSYARGRRNAGYAYSSGRGSTNSAAYSGRRSTAVASSRGISGRSNGLTASTIENRTSAVRTVSNNRSFQNTRGYSNYRSVGVDNYGVSRSRGSSYASGASSGSYYRGNTGTRSGSYRSNASGSASPSYRSSSYGSGRSSSGRSYSNGGSSSGRSSGSYNNGSRGSGGMSSGGSRGGSSGGSSGGGRRGGRG